MSTAILVSELGGDQAGVEVCAANDAYEFVYRLGTAKLLQEREKPRGTIP